MALPPRLKRLLEALGINVVRLEWKWRYFRERLQWRRTALAQWVQILSYRHKFCECGLLVDKDAKVCPGCGRKLHSRAVYRIGRLLGFVTPEVGVAWPFLLFLIAVVFLGEVRLGGWVSLLSPPASVLIRLGAVYTPAIAQGEYWRLLAAGLIHGGLIHIGFNLMALSQLAPALEDEIGPWEFILLVTVTQLGCGWATYFLRTFAFSVGASGIAFGLIGFGLSYSHRQGGGRGLALRDLYLKWAVYGFLFGMWVGADNLGHLGGLAAGVMFGLLAPTDPQLNARLALLWRILAMACLIAWGYTLVEMIRSLAA